MYTRAEAKVRLKGLWDEWLAQQGRPRDAEARRTFFEHIRSTQPELLNFKAAGIAWQHVKLWLEDHDEAAGEQPLV